MADPTPPPASAMEVVAAVYEAHSRHSSAGLAELLHPQVEWHQAEGHPYAGDRPWIGPEEVTREVADRINTEWDGFATEVTELIDAGDRVVMTGRYTGTHRGTGRSIDAQVCTIYTVHDGLITRWQQFTDTEQIRWATGADSRRPG